MSNTFNAGDLVIITTSTNKTQKFVVDSVNGDYCNVRLPRGSKKTLVYYTELKHI